MNVNNIIALGRTAEIISYDNQHILKLFKEDMPMNLIISEFNNTREVYNIGIQCPKPFEIIDYVGRKGIVYKRITGITMLRSIIEDPTNVIAEAKSLADIHLDIHQRLVENLPNQKELLAEQIKHAPLITNQEKDKVLKKLSELSDDCKLCHGDFHPDNIIYSEARHWVIDWMTGMKGTPAGDVARTYLILKLGRISDEIPKEVYEFISQIRNQILENYIKEYLKKSNISMNEVNNWFVPIAAARLGERIPDEEKKELIEVIRNNL
ncbi:aminoglycoside phosphotransferase [Paenibacillus montaniterrae]|uniref:Aminoglycoside phosphotransferase n=1 Tax=Paenibacillus montaniterrae TaxID=429341 RepID=A0A919YQE3_9BACL|nr:aminoglycoside phosphotransferase family protein [Paenibacillus montaniterrae]GIP17515.1 aminoglycoside phosphotransferase [Paenibacillus montaniterrae]